MNYAEDTKILVNPSGCTDSMSVNTSLSESILKSQPTRILINKRMAHMMLDAVREGSTTPANLIQAALHATGDL
jgi:hypothetical protein